MIINDKKLKNIPNSQDQTCFGCGAKNLHGLQMKFSTDDHRLYSFTKVPVAMAGWDKTVHGGILSTILDEVMGWSLIYLFKKLGVTKTITVNFVKPVQVKEQLTVVGGIQQKLSDRTVLMMGEIYKEDDTLCANATGEFTMMEPKLAVRLGLVSPDYMKMFEPILTFNYEG